VIGLSGSGIGKLGSLARSMLKTRAATSLVFGSQFKEAGQKFERMAEQSARTRLPSGGGLARRVAAARYRGNLKTTAMGMDLEMMSDSPDDLLGMDQGVVIHPVFGWAPWVRQTISAGWLSDPRKEMEDDLVDNVDSAATHLVYLIR
jgi:hypothetical protein